ncbi:MAG TPA: tyrosine-type recombinase/integrase [Hyphomicrobium sp.]|nr:tyrosine-type recombinase/integrase [Hyphomicrobium sp.]
MAIASRKKVPNLVERNGRFWARVVVPKDVRKVLGVTELREPLGGDWTVVNRKLPGVVGRMIDKIDAARAAIAADSTPIAQANRRLSTNLIARTHYAEELAMDEAVRTSDTVEGDDLFLFVDGYQRALQRVAVGRADDDEAEAVIGWAVDKFTARGNVNAPRGSAARREIRETLAAIQLENLRAAKVQREDVFAPPPEPRHPMLRGVAVDAAEDEEPDARKTIVEIAEQCAAARKRVGGTSADYIVGARIFEEFLRHPKAIKDITRKDVRAFVKALHEAPAHYKSRFPNLTFPDAVEANTKRHQPFPTFNPKTIEKWYGNVRTVLNYAVNNEIIKENPASGIKIEQPSTPAGSGRKPFSPEEISLIFSKRYFGKANSFGEREWCWLIALFTGLRPSEIAQLEIAGIRQERGVLVFDVDGEVKTEQTRRLLPVHSLLVKLGIECRARSLKEKGEKYLFPKWFKDGSERKTRNPSDNQLFSNFLPRSFNRTVLREQLKITDPNKVFYSLRHNLTTALKRAGVSRDLRLALTGHEDDSVMGGYEHDFAIEVLKEALEKIHFDGLDLTHMMPSR